MKKLWQGVCSKTLNQNKKLAIFLIIGLLHGLIYIFVTPPWWHHDEAGHFQVAWFIANHDRRPEWNEFDDALQTELLDSLEQYHIFDYTNYSPDSGGELPYWLLISQADDPPLYHSLASLPLRLLKNKNLILQNRALRFLSLAFFLTLLWISWELGSEFFGVSHPLRSLTTLFLALLPGFVNEMTAISNDPLVTLFFAIFLLAIVRLLKYGFSWRNLILLSTSAIAGYYTKNTAWISVGLLTALILFFMPFYKRLKLIPWVTILVASLTLPLLIFQWGDARYWYGNAPFETDTRQFDANAPLRNYVLQLPYSDTLHQRIPVEFLKPLRTQTLTLGFWAWASKPVSITAPQIIFSLSKGFISSDPQEVDLSPTPTFYLFFIDVPIDSGRGWLTIKPAIGDRQITNISIYFDGIVLVNGKQMQGQPQFTDFSGASGIWGGRSFENLIRNGSFEEAWLSFSPLAWDKVVKKIPFLSTSTLAALQDWQGSGWYFKRTLVTLNETFWGKFGPSTVPMLGSPYIYQYLRYMGITGLLGAIIFTWFNIKRSNKRILFFLGLGTLIIWGQTLLRGTAEMDGQIPLIPWTRYALPAILPTVMVLCTGWFAFLNEIGKKLNFPVLWLYLLAFILSLDIISLLTMLQFFYLQTQWPYLFFLIALQICLFLIFIICPASSRYGKFTIDNEKINTT